MKTWRWAGGAMALAAVGALAWWGFGRYTEPEVSYRTGKIERGALQAAVSATGTVTPVTQVQISSQVSGQIKELFVDFNSEVKKGQLIARLDPETFEYRLRQGQADVEASRASVLTAQANEQSALAQQARAQVDLAEAQRDERRKLDLVAQNFISPAEIDTSKARAQLAAEALKVAQAQVAVARAQAQNALAIVRQREAQLAQARVDLERTQIRSPVDGIVIKRSVEVGQTVAASLQAPELFVIARNLSDMQVEAAIDEADISRVRDGLRATFTIDAFPGRSFEGSVRQVRKAAVSAQNVVSYTVVIGFANTGALLLPGMTANVRVVTETRDSVLKVPNAALRVRIPGVEPEAAASAAAASSSPARTGSVFGWIGTAQAQGQPRPGALRERLVEGLKLDESQQVQLDAVLADLRPRFIALRDLDESQRVAVRETLMTELRGKVNAFLTPAQREVYQQLQAQAREVREARDAGATGAAPASAATGGVRAAARSGDAAASSAAVPALPPQPAQPAQASQRPASAVLGDAPGAGPLREFRQRLIDELGLSPAQVAQIDAIFAAQRPRFGELRGMVEAERAKARERILADMRALIGEQLTPEQRTKYQALLAAVAGRQATRGRIYLLGADGKPRAFNVRLGITDGVMTELIVPPNSPDAAVLVEGATVITAVVTPGSGSGSQVQRPPPTSMQLGPRIP